MPTILAMTNYPAKCWWLFFLGLGQGRVGKGWWKRRKEGKEGEIALSLFVGYENAIWCAVDEFIATDLEIS